MTDKRIHEITDDFKQDMQRLGLGVSIQVPGGPMVKVTDPPEQREEDRMAAAAPELVQQLSFDIGAGFAQPDQSSFKIGGSLTSKRNELPGDEDVLVQVVTEDGEVIASSYGKVSGLSFKKHRPKDQRPWVERIHSIELTDGKQEQIH